MILKLMITGLVLVGAFFAPGPQDDKTPQDMEKIIAVYEKAAVPGEIHKSLATAVGKWDLKGECPMGPITGTVEYKSVLGGRFLLSEGTMKMGGAGGKPSKEAQRIQIIGYDNALKQYQTTWLDSMGTGIYLSTGTADASGKVVTYEAPVKDALTPQGRPFKVVVTEGDDQRTIEIWDAMDGKTLAKVATVTETRVK